MTLRKENFMLRFLAQRRFNYIEYVSLGIASGLLYSDKVSLAITTFIVGLLLSFVVEVYTEVFSG